MLDSQNLRTASLYINNQLLSRGLLRDGQNIDFADPECGKGDAGLEGTMGQIISLVNDLILRRDRDAEHRESLSSTLRTLRADTQRQTTETQRQADKLAETQRRLDVSESTERALRSQLKTTDHAVHKLKDEVAKMKTLVAQTRSSCANEVRKRDRQIDSLKKAVADAGRVRGGGKSRDVMAISVTGDYGAEDHAGGLGIGATEDEGYSLRMETNGFLTELAKGLSEENEGLLALVRRTVEGLREMSGLDRIAEEGAGEQQRRANVAGHALSQDDLVIQVPQKTAEELAAELEAIVTHLKSILTNPSFVPIEEVEVRDEAIARLGAGLETMEARWKDAVLMIDGWRKRMTSSGKTVDIEDLNMGLRLSPVRVRDVDETAGGVAAPMRLSCVQEEEEEEEQEEEEQEEDVGEPDARDIESDRRRSLSAVESLHLEPAPESAVPRYEVDDDDESDSDSSIYQDELELLEDFEAEEPNVQILQESVDSPPLPSPPQISPLKDNYSSGNRGSNGLSAPGAHRDRRREDIKPAAVDFSTIVEEDTWDLAGEEPGREKVEAGLENPPPVPAHTAGTYDSPEEPSQPTRPSSATSSAYDSPLFGKSGERPSQTSLTRKLFSTQKPSEPSAETRTVTRTTTTTSKSTGARKSTNSVPAAAAKRTNSDPTATAASKQQRRTRSPVQQTSSSTTAPSSSGSSAAQTSASSSSRSTTTTTTAAPPTSSRLPRRHSKQPPQSPLSMATITAKLAASEREADAARVRAKLKAVRRSSGRGAITETDAPTTTASASTPEEQQRQRNSSHADEVGGEEQQEDMDPVKRSLSSSSHPRRTTLDRFDESVDELALPGDEQRQQQQQEGDHHQVVVSSMKEAAKRKRDRRTSKVASRRRSTLSPWELDSLISGNVAAGDAAEK